MSHLLGERGSLRNRLIKSTVGSAGLKLVYVGLQFLVGVLLARLLGAQSLGQYAFIMALVQVIGILTQSGFPLYFVRKVALQQETKKPLELRHTVLCGVFAVSLFSGLLVLLVQSLPYLLPRSPATLNYLSYLPHAIWLVIPISLVATISGALKGMGLVVLAQIPDLVIKPVLLVTALSAVHLFRVPLAVSDALNIQILAALCALFAALLSLRTYMPAGPWRQTPSAMLREARESRHFLLLAGGQVLNYQTNMLLLGVLASPTEVGLYRVALQLVDGLGIAMLAISVVIAPQLARLHAKDDWGKIQRVLVLSHRAAVVVMLLPVGVILMFGSSLLELIYGTEYVAAQTALSILSVGKIMYATVGFSGLALGMLGRPGFAAVITFTTVGSNMLLGLLLIRPFGVQGAAVAAAVSMFAANTYALLWLNKQSGRGFAAFSRLGKH